MILKWNIFKLINWIILQKRNFELIFDLKNQIKKNIKIIYKKKFYFEIH